MPFNGSGIYNLPVTTVTPAVSGTTIDDSEFNAFTADLKDALTNCIVKDGQTTSPTLTTPSIVTPTISGSPVFTADILMGKASPALSLRPTDEVTQNTSINYFDETATPRAVLYRPLGASKVRLDARNAAGAVQAALDITEAGGIDVAVGTFSATGAALTTPALTNATGSLNGVTGSLTSPVINTGVSGTAGVRGIFILDTPELLVSSVVLSTWTTHSSTTLATALAKTAILRVRLNGSGGTGSCSAEGFIRKTGSALAANTATSVCRVADYHASALAVGADTNDCFVNLDASYDFDYHLIRSLFVTYSISIYLVGYYV